MASLGALPNASAPGWFGKIPNLGDFVSRRLPDAFVRGWDDWLQRGLSSAQSELGADWLARYLVAPVRRFWIAPNVLGGNAWAGVMMPSVDAVGRYFPLTLALPMTPRAGGLEAVLAASAWFDAIDAAARSALDEHVGADDLEHVLSQVQPLHADADGTPTAAACGSAWWCGDGSNGAPLDRFAALPPAAAFARLLLEPIGSGAGQTSDLFDPNA